MTLNRDIFQPIKALNNRLAGSYSYLLLTIASLTFCFFLGFPFAIHNESYIWVVIFKKASLWDTLTKQLTGGIETFRPLGMANAWLTYKLSGNVYLQEILNWLFAVSSFAVLFIYADNKTLFSIAAFIGAACFFSGYIYLFHLHGVFYGPFQLYVAALVCIAYTRTGLSFRTLVILTITTIIVSLYHTFALPVFCAFLCGYLIQAFRKGNRSEILMLLILLLVTAGFAKIILHSKEFKTLPQLLEGFFASYRMTEFNKPLSVLSLLFSMLTVMPVLKRPEEKLLSFFILLVIAAILYWCNVPVMMLWIAACFIKPLLKGNWAMAGLIAVTAILPAASGSGSPTYNVFVIMACLFVTSADNTLFARLPAYAGKLALGVVIILLAVLLPLLKSGVQVPVASVISRPILAEEEKTHQLEDIIAWKIKNKEYVSFNLEFVDATDLPVNSKTTINRQNRAVTMQSDLNSYMDNISPETHGIDKMQHLYITFGDKILKDKAIVFAVNGTWNGKAYVFHE